MPFSTLESISPSPAPSSAAAAPCLPFEHRACIIAGPAKSGTTLLTSLLDGHPQLLVLPEETAYFPTVLTKYGGRPRREQFDYLTRQALAGVMFGAPPQKQLGDYSCFPTRELRDHFESAAFNPANLGRDLLVLLMESYAALLERPTDAARWWVEKTPANRDHLPRVFLRFPHARVLMTIRDPRALLATQIQLERNRRRRRFSIYLTLKHWRTAARVALQQLGPAADERILVVGFRRMLETPEKWMRKICAFLEVPFDPTMLRPTKVGRQWTGNSAAKQAFDRISTEPCHRWRKELSETEIGWVEWHCRDLMEPLGYEPVLSQRRLKHWIMPVCGETPREYCKSRWYSLRRWEQS